MDSFMSSIKSAAGAAVSGGDDKKSHPDPASNSDLMTSAKTVAEAAQFAATNQSEKIDKPKVAGAASDLLDAAKGHGKFDETQGVGKYLKQADDYLHQYEKSGGGGVAAPPATEEKKAEAPPCAEEKKEEGGSGFGAADAFKAAGSFLK